MSKAQSFSGSGRIAIRLSVVLGVFAGFLHATPITGRLILDGTSLAGVDLNTTDFNYAGGVPSATTFGTFLVDAGSTGSFSAYVNDDGLVRSFNRATVPLGVPTSYANFIQIPSPSPTIEFVLTQLIPGSYGSADCTATPAPGQTCTPPIPGGSPFELSNSSNGTGGINTHADFNVDVEAINLVTGETSNGQGTFSTDFSDTSFQSLLATIEAGGVVTSGEHGDFTITFSGTTTPEPPSMVFVAGGLLVMISAVRRKVTGFRKDR